MAEHLERAQMGRCESDTARTLVSLGSRVLRLALIVSLLRLLPDWLPVHPSKWVCHGAIGIRYRPADS
jgi:hypothetical protein